MCGARSGARAQLRAPLSRPTAVRIRVWQRTRTRGGSSPCRTSYNLNTRASPVRSRPPPAACLRRRRAPRAAAALEPAAPRGSRHPPRRRRSRSLPDAVPFAAVTAADVAAEFEMDAAAPEVEAGAARGSGTAGATTAARAYWELARRNFKKVRHMHPLRRRAGARGPRAAPHALRAHPWPAVACALHRRAPRTPPLRPFGAAQQTRVAPRAGSPCRIRASAAPFPAPLRVGSRAAAAPAAAAAAHARAGG